MYSLHPKQVAVAHISDHITGLIPGLCVSSRRRHITKPAGIYVCPPKQFRNGNLVIKTDQKFKWVVKLSLVDQSPPKSTIDAKRLVDFLYEDLPHLFDDQGIDRTAYDERVKFRDPITKHDSISGYLFNIALLKTLFTPDFQLHWVKQTGPYEMTTRWTMVMRFIILPWKPELVFTGTSVMGINPETEKFCSHVDYWDSIEKNDYFSLEGLWDVIKQLRVYKTPELESPKYQILKRTAKYEVRKYTPFIVVEADGDKLSGSTGINAVTGYIFGKNSTMEKTPMTTPVFTQVIDSEMSKVSIQIVLPSEKDMSSLPDPNQESISLRKVEGGIAAVSKFSGKPTEDIVCEKEKALRSSLIRDGLRPKNGCLLARYNDPGRTWSFIMFNRGTSAMQHYVATRPMFIDMEVMNADTRLVLGDQGTLPSPSNVAHGLSSLYKEITDTVRKEAATIMAVFPFANDVMSILVQRVLEQRATTLLDKLLQKPSLVNPPPMEEGGLLLYLRVLAVAYEKMQELARDLHAVGCGDLEVEGLTEFLFLAHEDQYIEHEQASLRQLYKAKMEELRAENPQSSESTGSIGRSKGASLASSHQQISVTVVTEFVRWNEEAITRCTLLSSQPATLAANVKAVFTCLLDQVGQYITGLQRARDSLTEAAALRERFVLGTKLSRRVAAAAAAASAAEAAAAAAGESGFRSFMVAVQCCGSSVAIVQQYFANSISRLLLPVDGAHAASCEENSYVQCRGCCSQRASTMH
ncbi:uncharacterized protein LOC132277245 isoform X2 [Cornus florida]|uniref:uncharacterized protein LOC132277245 isoform X2 n=1 Tax=Cornus florida TaxID=4283 RepID=UPI00289FBC1A|nr:uncharacterized protein LOC132277245 isoform X2 [Cornus florida]XP_059635023.1 uncharacterized protein LOC132277245 isoform X2 [Cornus florida]